MRARTAGVDVEPFMCLEMRKVPRTEKYKNNVLY